MAPSSAPRRICPRGALCGQRAGTTKSMIAATPALMMVARSRAGVLAQVLLRRARVCSVVSLTV